MFFANEKMFCGAATIFPVVQKIVFSESEKSFSIVEKVVGKASTIFPVVKKTLSEAKTIAFAS
jgi:hypothetical protein